MITGIEIENFKGVRERVCLDLRPITLLFGANSSGKSTCIHALHYAREIFERHNLDPDQTIAGGSYVDLGGFQSLVHGRDLSRSVKIRIDISVTEDELPDFFAGYDELSALMGVDVYQLLRRDVLESVGVELTIQWSRLKSCPYVSSNKIFINESLFAEITAKPNLREVCVSNIETFHPSLFTGEDHTKETTYPDGCAIEDPRSTDPVLDFFMSECQEAIAGYNTDVLPLTGQNDAYPNVDKPLNVDFNDSEGEFVTENGKTLHSDTDDYKKVKFAKTIMHSLSSLIIGPCQLIRDQLKEFRYLGPLRETPPRNYRPPRRDDPARWASGLGAWDALQNNSENLVTRVGDWLGNTDKLNSGFKVERQDFLELNTAEENFVKVISGKAFEEADADDDILSYTKGVQKKYLVVIPDGTNLQLRPHDVGVGISQVIPVVVTALDGKNRALAIEQPELHLHPRLQAELADLFIEAALGDSKHLVILETHSEHLIYRFMRRIRESEQGQATLFDRQLQTTDIAIHYLSQIDGSSSVRRIDVDVNGEFVQPWPDDFFDIEFNERFPDAR